MPGSCFNHLNLIAVIAVLTVKAKIFSLVYKRSVRRDLKGKQRQFSKNKIQVQNHVNRLR